MIFGLKVLGLRIIVQFFMVITLLIGFSGFAFAAKLGTAKSCDTLRAQRNALVVLGVKENMKQGAMWAKNNLPEPELYLLRNYLKIDEKVRFRCKAIVKKVAKKRSRKRKKRTVRR